jgi:hypothetical protein
VDGRRGYLAAACADGAFARLTGVRSMLIVPMLKDNKLTGVIAIYRQEARPFTDKQIELVTTFADQAVIAIENARLFEEVQARTRELSEALEQQTATSEVLGVISTSPGELEPVFQTMLANAVRICEAKIGTLYIREVTAARASSICTRSRLSTICLYSTCIAFPPAAPSSPRSCYARKCLRRPASCHAFPSPSRPPRVRRDRRYRPGTGWRSATCRDHHPVGSRPP